MDNHPARSDGLVQALQITGRGDLELVDLAPPSRANDHALIAVQAVGICGSDVAVAEGSHPFARYPVISGHEIAGVVIEAPAGSVLSAGQRVAVEPMVPCGRCPTCLAGHPNRCSSVQVMGVQLPGGMIETMAVRLDHLHKVPGSLSADLTALVEPLAVAIHVCRRGQLEAGTSVAVLGTGKIGILCLAVADAWGCGPLFGVDKVAQRCSWAQRIGDTAVANNRSENALAAGMRVNPGGFQVVIDTAGEPETFQLATELAAPGGIVIPVALPHAGVPIDFQPIYRKELTVRASRMYVDEFGPAIHMLANGDIDGESLITHHFPLQQAHAAFDLAANHPERALKVIVHPSGEMP